MQKSVNKLGFNHQNDAFEETIFLKLSAKDVSILFGMKLLARTLYFEGYKL
jgi:hypothetical protein